MSSKNIQLVKWTLPAFALIVGFFWYKRRRVDRVDPGGARRVPDDIKEAVSNGKGKSVEKGNFYDSGIHIDESFTLNSSNSNTEESHCSPRRVSESLDIPTRRSSSQALTMQVEKSLENDEMWYNEGEIVANTIVLGSNPKSSNFEMSDSMRDMMMMTKNKSGEGKIVKLFDHVTEEEEPTSAVSSSVYDEKDEGSSIEHHQRYCSIESCSKSDESGQPKLHPGQVICERDSANHSPVSGVLEGSVTDEVRSEGSTDSGKGGSIKGHPKDPTLYQFAIPQTLVGRLIGKRGTFLHQINNKAGVSAIVKRHPTSKTEKLCEINGTPDAIKVALKLIRQKFPEKKFPDVSLEQISVTRHPDEIAWVSELMHLQLIEGVNNDVIVCHIYKPSRIFVQLPTHPTYPSLRILDQNMTQLYDNIESPPVPDQLSKGMLVVTKWYDKWVRAYVEDPDPNGQQNLVRLVDHGGYWNFSNAQMRKIRSDYLTLPFQAIEVFLAHIQPVGGEWKQEAYDIVAQICSGSIGQAQIEGYIDSNVYVSLYINIQKHGVISLADELMARGYAEPVTLEDVAPEEHLPIA